MHSRVRLYSNQDGEIYKFLHAFFQNNINSEKNVFDDMYLHLLEWENIYSNPVEIADILGVYIDNKDCFNINMWINLDKNVFIKITENNADNIIRYLYERYPY